MAAELKQRVAVSELTGFCRIICGHLQNSLKTKETKVTGFVERLEGLEKIFNVM